MRILMVENHATFAAVVTQQFLSEYDVDVVSTIAGALARDLSVYDAVLLDYDLDDGSGDEFLFAIRTTHVEMPIVAISSHHEGNNALRQAGANAVCAKGDFSGIGEVISGLLRQRTP